MVLSGFLNRESEVRILPGALSNYLQIAENKNSPGAKPGLSDTILTPPRLSEGGVHRTGCGVSHVGKHVRVHIQGNTYVGVA